MVQNETDAQRQIQMKKITGTLVKKADGYHVLLRPKEVPHLINLETDDLARARAA